LIDIKVTRPWPRETGGKLFAAMYFRMRRSPNHPNQGISMKSSRGVAHVSHQFAQVIEFDDSSTHVVKTEQHAHATRQHGSQVRSEHEFFASVCELIERFDKVLVTGGHTALADFQHYVAKHRPLVAGRIAAYEIVDHPSENQLVAMARKRFDELERLA
jgi:stalled ribosome rescue protein Dom34